MRRYVTSDARRSRFSRAQHRKKFAAPTTRIHGAWPENRALARLFPHTHRVGFDRSVARENTRCFRLKFGEEATSRKATDVSGHRPHCSKGDVGGNPNPRRGTSARLKYLC